MYRNIGKITLSLSKSRGKSGSSSSSLKSSKSVNLALFLSFHLKGKTICIINFEVDSKFLEKKHFLF